MAVSTGVQHSRTLFSTKATVVTVAWHLQDLANLKHQQGMLLNSFSLTCGWPQHAGCDAQHLFRFQSCGHRPS